MICQKKQIILCKKKTKVGFLGKQNTRNSSDWCIISLDQLDLVKCYKDSLTKT